MIDNFERENIHYKNFRLSLDKHYFTTLRDKPLESKHQFS